MRMRAAQDPTTVLVLTGAVLARDQTQITGHLRRAVKSRDVIHRRNEGTRRNGPNARQCHQALRHRIRRDELRKLIVSGGEFVIEHFNDAAQWTERRRQRCRKLEGAEPIEQRLGAAAPKAKSFRPSDRAGDQDGARSTLGQFPADIEHRLHDPLPRGSAMSGAVIAVETRVGQSGGVSAICLDAATASGIHRAVIRICHDHLVPQAFQMARDPLAFGRRFDQNPRPCATPEDRGEPIPRGQDAAVNDFTIRGDNPDLAFSFVQINGTIVHGWSPSLRLKSARRYVERKLPPHLGDQPVHPICGRLLELLLS
jgi:hypothetical protein